MERIERTIRVHRPRVRKYRLTASRVGYTQQGLDQHEGFMTAIAVGPKLDSEHIHFRLFRESVIAGTVLDEYGEPVRSADMFLFRRGFSGGAHTTDLAGRATADDLGVYRFPHLAPAHISSPPMRNLGTTLTRKSLTKLVRIDS